jgi:hypothetical protein
MPALASAAVLAIVVAFARGTLSPSQATASDTTNTPAAVRPPPVEIPKQPMAGEEPPARPQIVRISVRTVPQDAIIRIDDGPGVASPYVGEVLATGNSRVIEASAPGYTSELRRVIFDRDQELVLELSPSGKDPKDAKRAKTKKPPRGKSEPSVQPTQPVSSPVPSSVSQSEPTPRTKKPRTLDADNPFGG